MFQFPGFALKTLCVQVFSTCLSQPLIARAINDELSGGFPHSEIPGSKPILGSPGLIAEYHVLHRLLLPRHPPNALIALDLIRKKTNWSPSGSKASSHFPALPRKEEHWLVYLTWTTPPPGSRGSCRPHTRGRHGDADVYLSVRCQIRPTGRANPALRACRSCRRFLILVSCQS